MAKGLEEEYILNL
jgi:hypothetical protein